MPEAGTPSDFLQILSPKRAVTEPVYPGGAGSVSSRKAKTESEKNPKRVLAGRLNHSKRQGFTADGLQRLRDTIHIHKPWLQTSGPTTAAGKQQCRENGCKTRRGDHGGRALRRQLAETADLIAEMRIARQGLYSPGETISHKEDCDDH